MGTAYMIISAGIFVLETIMQLCVVGAHSKGSEALFVILLALVMAPLILINFVSAIQVTRTQDFTGKDMGRIICIVFHSFQLGVVWRSLKLLILYDQKDWLDYLNMKLFHTGFQSLPFCVVLTYSMFINESKSALDIATIVFTLISASISLTTYRTGSILFEADDIENRKSSVKKHVGIAFLILSTFSVLFSRYSSIVLFTVVQPFWIALPLSLHFIVHICIELCKLKCDNENILSKVANAIYISFVNIFEMVGRDYSGVKCSYVLFYSLMLIENLVFSFYWMLTASFDERFKLFAVLLILLCFIAGLIVKFASCGYIFNVESDILSDAFNNPEFKSEKEIQNEKFAKAERNNVDEGGNVFHEIHTNDTGNVAGVAVISRLAENTQTASRHSKRGSSGSSNSRQIEYDNQAFVQSQGNLSLHSHMTPRSNKRSQGSDNKRSSEGADVSFEVRTLSRSSQERSHTSQKQSHGSREHSGGSAKRTRGKSGLPESTHKYSSEQLDRYFTKDSRKPPLRPKIIVSDSSKHTQLTQSRIPPKHLNKINNVDMASSNSRYSRNTHTLNGSVQQYRYNGFDDPFREKKALNKRKQKPKSRLNNYYQQQHHQQHQHSRHTLSPNMDYSLDSSELYPSMTSDTSSMSSYTDTNERMWRQQRQRFRKKCRQFDSRDGYSTDVSNSDYLSFNDYSMEDSSSWTESSSSSDGAATWPPSQSANLLKMYNIPDKNSSTENIMHWLDTMEMEGSVHDTSFSTLHEPSVASDTDISLTAMQTFEVKKEKKKFKRLISKPKGFLLKFSSLNYKGREKSFQKRPYPLNKGSGTEQTMPDTMQIEEQQNEHVSMSKRSNGMVSVPAMPLPIESVQESIV